MISYGAKMAIPIETGVIAEIEVVRQPLDPKILGGLAIESVDNDVLRLTSQRLEDYFMQLLEDRSQEFGECLAYGVNLPTEEVDKLTDHLVKNAGAIGENITQFETSTGLEFLWAMRFATKRVTLRRIHGPIMFTHGVEDDGTVFSINSSSRVASL